MILLNYPQSTAPSMGLFLNANSAIIANGLTGGTTVALEVKIGDNWAAVVGESGAVTLTESAPQHRVLAAATYRVVPSAASSALVVEAMQAI